jgi:hypothetical protein
MATSEAPAMSAFALRNLEAKHEKILKELSRVAANRKCVDCDNIVRNLNHLDLRLGDPLLLALAAYANACFSCSAGSAVCDYIIRRFRLHRVWRPSVSLLFYFFRSHRLPLHSLKLFVFCLLCSRQYGHRVKGISMSKFSKEEIAELQNGGNEVRKN